MIDKKQVVIVTCDVCGETIPESDEFWQVNQSHVCDVCKKYYMDDLKDKFMHNLSGVMNKDETDSKVLNMAVNMIKYLPARFHAADYVSEDKDDEDENFIGRAVRGFLDDNMKEKDNG